MSAPGWYPAPSDPVGTVRWWDGTRWTQHLAASTSAPASQKAPVRHEVAGVGLRIAARIADSAIAVAVVTSINKLVAVPGIPGDLGDLRFDDLSDGDIFLAATIFTSLAFFVWEFLWLITEGATPGKQLLGLYVRDLDGARETVSPVPAIKRNAQRLIYAVPWLGITAMIGVSAVSIVLMQRKAETRPSVMDLFAKTSVRRLPAGSPRFTPWLQVTIGLIVATRGLAYLLDTDSLQSLL